MMLTCTLLLLSPLSLQDEQREPIISLKPKPAEQAETTTLPPAEQIERFEKADFEGRWFQWETELATTPESKALWIPWLAEHHYYDILEWNTLAHNDWGSTGTVLAACDAPQWLRVALRLHTSSDSHTWDGAKQALEAQPALALSWLDDHPEKLEGNVLELYRQLSANKTERVDTSRYLSPLEDVDVFGPLEATGTLIDFAERTFSLPGEVYVHQVLRSIDALSTTSDRPQRWRRALLQLTSNKDEEVRRAAYLAYSHFDPVQIPCDAFRAVVHNPNQPAGTRAAALVAFSYGPDYPVYAELLALIRNPEHPAWQVTVARLGDLGDALTLKGFEQVPADRLDETKAALLVAQVTRVRGRVPSNGQAEAETLRRIAWARATEHPLADWMEREGLEAIGALADSAGVRDRILSEVESWEPAAWLAEPVALTIRYYYADYADRISQ